ncbi:MAG: S-methyl-5-thioribose-1-phosphate isomerase [Bacteroidetes bacterium GWF2_38_335]|nr:MAG: S-methyl-5-thioribose-1-phosphate isomerase [Bacteroidetes bacterium GWF2_38_335]OFY79323.1 MAG: S-methyl-5-thioribose-1-phosphate isomerase [Bacteroidetes bacterium RIFOXYA12_FULL_38_20]HBS85581.1 S-methyl-5-thioribose-1-phosphate isomerase [Bacteroidales bacterium]
MNIRGKHFTAVWLNHDKKSISIINQLLLPFNFEIKELESLDDVYFAIKNMEVRGAPLIGITAAFGMYLACLHSSKESEIRKKAEYLKSSRPTAVNLMWAVDNVCNAALGAQNMQKAALDKAMEIFNSEIENCRLIGEYGLPIIEEISKRKNGETVNILTHCNAGWIACGDYGTATAPIYLAHDRGIKVHVWVDETRPRNQGARLTAWELKEHGIDCTIIPDNTGGHLMQHGMVDMAIVGSDRTTATGDVANKIGTYLKALAAFDNKIPFYVALPSSTIDFSISDGIKQIEIETRCDSEVKYMEGLINGRLEKMLIMPEKAKIANYGFDVTPARLVTAIITERGICKADAGSIKKLFPEKF